MTAKDARILGRFQAAFSGFSRISDAKFRKVASLIFRSRYFPRSGESRKASAAFSRRRYVRDTDYGKCVFQMDNDVVDHQVVNLLMEDGVTVNFTMIAFTNKMTREIRVMGTEGEIWGDFKEKKVYWQRFGGKVNEIDLEALTDDFTGHGGGDWRLIHDVIRLVRGDRFDQSSITTLDRSVESHYVAFAAEASRLKEGAPVDPAIFAK